MGFLDRVVDGIAKLADALGFNGTRLRWRWNQRRRRIGEDGIQASMMWRSARGKHKMCRECRALLPRGASKCPECGASMSGVRGPGVGRALSNIFPGIGSATGLIVLANGVWFLLTLMAGMRAGAADGFGSVLFFRGEFGEILAQFGMLNTQRVWLLGEWWRIIPPIFLHGGLLHFFFNTYITLQIGPAVEEEYGTARYFVAYLFSGMTGYVATVLWSAATHPKFSLGASGAILGLMGLLLAHGLRRGGHAGARIKRGIGQYVLYIFLISILIPRVDHAAHIGGLIGGFLIGFVMPYGPYRDRRQAIVWDGLAVAGLVLILLAYVRLATALP